MVTVVSGLLSCSLFFGEPAPLKPLPELKSPLDTGVPSVVGDLRLVRVEPTAGPSDGGIEVVIRGSFPSGDLSVRFGETEATLVESEADALVVIAPPGSPGMASVWVEQGPRFSFLEGAFTYFDKRRDRVGLIGEVRRNQLVGDYWAPTEQSSGLARFGFTDLEDWSLTDDFGTSGCTWSFNPSLPPATDIQATGVPLVSDARTITLDPLETPGYFGGTLLADNVLAGTRFSLGPIVGQGLPTITVDDLVEIPPSFAVTAPLVDSEMLQPVSRSFTLEWTGQGGDAMVLDLQRAYDVDGTLTFIDEMRCTFPDTGSFEVDGTLWPDWYAQEVLFIRLGRMIEVPARLPHDAAQSRVASVFTVVGAAVTEL
ncbi:MAG: IPT/TIG domain-containing protein [Myxococcota bacterium]